MNITRDVVESILNFYGPIGDNDSFLEINNVSVYRTAFTHESYIVEDSGPRSERVESNETLEFLGDSILKAVIGRYLCERFSTQREGFLTKIKIKIEQSRMLHKFGLVLGFNRFLLLAQQIDNQTILDIDRGRNTPSYYEDAFESFIGAIIRDYGDIGYIYADRFIRNVIENNVDFVELIAINDNFKDSLQRYMQKQGVHVPKYIGYNVEESQKTPVYKRVYTKIVLCDYTLQKTLPSDTIARMKMYTMQSIGTTKSGLILGIGHGKKVIKAEQMAARQALLNLGVSLNY